MHSGMVFSGFEARLTGSDQVSLEVMHSLGAIHVLHGKWYASFLTI